MRREVRWRRPVAPAPARAHNGIPGLVTAATRRRDGDPSGRLAVGSLWGHHGTLEDTARHPQAKGYFDTPKATPNKTKHQHHYRVPNGYRKTAEGN